MKRNNGKSVDWTTVLDVKRGAANVEGDLIGDWYVDPWGWPELKWLLDGRQAKLLGQELKRRTPGRLTRLAVPKENFGIRPASVMSIGDRLIFQSLVDRCTKPLVGDLPAHVFNWRLQRSSPASGAYVDSSREWSDYRDHLNNALLDERVQYMLETDIVSCFAQIPTERVCTLIEDRTGPNAASEKLVKWIRAWDSSTPGHSGLPQRSRASAAIANAYLRPVDDVIIRAPARARWMDDISAFTRSEAEARAIQSRLNDVVREIGLELNLAKTQVLDEDGASAKINDLELNAISYGLNRVPEEWDLAPLNEKLLELERTPSTINRTVINFVCTQVIKHKLHTEAERLLEVADRAPHAADHFARVARMLEMWGGRYGWYEAYYASGYAHLKWAAGHLLLMFPLDANPTSGMKSLVEKAILAPDSELVMLASAATRMIGWEGAESIDLFRKAINQTDEPLSRRVLAVGALVAGEERQAVRRWLSDSPDLKLTLNYLEDRSFRPPKLHRRFSDPEPND